MELELGLVFVVAISLFMSGFGSAADCSEFGKLLGRFPDRTQHDVAGTIYVINENTIWVRGFSYDGTAPDAFFYGGSTDSPSSNGEIIPDEFGTTQKLGKYDNDNLILTLPVGKTINSYKWISIWCREFRVDFGHVDVPSTFVAPGVRSLGELGFPRRVHDVHADDVIVLNTRQIQFINLDYDGFGPAAFFWVDRGNSPTGNGKRVPHEDDNGGDRLRRYSGETILVTLPEGSKVTDYGNIGLWCVAAFQNFGHVTIPSDLCVPPYMSEMMAPAMQNCEVLLKDKFHVEWTVDEANNKITMQFIGAVDIQEYMAFGISGSDRRTSMVNSDVTVAYMNSNNNMPVAEDYSLNDYAQCTVNDGNGACPDILQGGTDDVEVMGGIIRNGVTHITFERPLNSGDTTADKPIPLDGPTYISWGIGDINPSGHVSKHDIRTEGSIQVDFGSPSSRCPVLTPPTVGDGDVKPWKIEPITPKPEDVITARIGPSGGASGYKAIAGQVGWGIAWYINGQLIPELHVERNHTYTFKIYGGDDEDALATYHPFYITDDKDGGYTQKSEAEKRRETIYAKPVVGNLCEYKTSADPDDFKSFKDFKETLTLECLDGEVPGTLTWYVAEDTPDLVYYQCYQHRYFGWKIHVSHASVALYQLPLILLLVSTSIFNLF